MQADQARMDAISHNTANVLTPGFKRQISTSSAFSVQVAQGLDSVSASITPAQESPTQLSIDPTAGAMRPTGSPHDVAIEGPGFFEVQTAKGTFYTKLGSIRADLQGRLVVADDVPLMGVGGELRVTNNPFTIASNGEVKQDERVVGRLKIVNFTNPQALVPSGGGLYLAGKAQLADTRTDNTLRVGFLEGSNVSSPQEMVRLSETVRHFESLQKVVQGYDDTLEKTIRKLGDF